MNTKLNVVRFENEDVIATSGEVSLTFAECDHGNYSRVIVKQGAEVLNNGEHFVVDDTEYAIGGSDTCGYQHLRLASVNEGLDYRSELDFSGLYHYDAGTKTYTLVNINRAD